MKILYAIQGTGNGHLSRAYDVYPELIKYGSVDVLISGIQVDIPVPFPVKYRLHGMSFIFGRHGGVDIWSTLRNTRLPQLIRDIRQLPVNDYDLVINDFEPVSAWACRMRKKKCIALSHQSAVLHTGAPKPGQKDLLGITVLRHYAPSSRSYGFHFESFASNIFTPVIRRELRAISPGNEGHYTVYLPAYDDETIVKHLSVFNNVDWHVFSKHNQEPFSFKRIQVQPISNEAFIKSMATADGVLCGAGFETPAETLFLQKKLMVIPMAGQYEQQCNAAMLEQMGVMVIKALDPKYYSRIHSWLDHGSPIPVHYPDHIASVVRKIMDENTGAAFSMAMPGRFKPAF